MTPGLNPLIMYMCTQYVFWICEQEKSTYDAVKKDVAHVNIFFEENHCMGELAIRAAEYTHT